MQDSICSADPVHGEPPLAATIASDLMRVLIPSTSSQDVAEQVDHSPYSPHMQLTFAIGK